MIKDFILKIEKEKTEIYIVYFDLLKPIKYYVYKNQFNNYEFCELDKNGRFINRSNTDFILTEKELKEKLYIKYIDL